MKNLLAANIVENNKRSGEIKTLLKAQVHNSLDVGWKPENIILVTNFNFEYMGIKSYNTELNKTCLTGTKLFALKYVFDNNLHKEEGLKEMVWSHDLDAWQNEWFFQPTLIEDVGATYYGKPKFNGGSIFWRPESKDILEEAIEIILSNNEAKEEPTLNDLFKNKYKDRVNPMNNTFNVGCSSFRERYMRSSKPIKVAHFHPYNRIAWETHRLDRDGIGFKSVDFRLEMILRQYYPKLAFTLSPEGRQAQEKKAKRNYEKLLEEYQNSV